MNGTWDPEGGQTFAAISAMGWLRVATRAPLLIAVLLLGVIITMILRMFERPIWGRRRPVTAFVTQWVCRFALMILGLRQIKRS